MQRDWRVRAIWHVGCTDLFLCLVNVFCVKEVFSVVSNSVNEVSGNIFVFRFFVFLEGFERGPSFWSLFA